MVSVELAGIEPRSDSRQFLCNKSSQSYPSAPANSLPNPQWADGMS